MLLDPSFHVPNTEAAPNTSPLPIIRMTTVSPVSPLRQTCAVPNESIPIYPHL